ncbi:sensor domain-containing protein [Actinoallomurus spadix]|uniref:histidine kinase n=1 Tax=Actinoallomurus spadix TaxID=79912 RepID=A0ABN0XUB9_9ACTN|nr:sensor histidine kinase [Actinoallomurus spadix]MCO5990453.1 sensor domain-containing protein [Actinoallomurus spadix]
MNSPPRQLPDHSQPAEPTSGTLAEGAPGPGRGRGFEADGGAATPDRSGRRRRRPRRLTRGLLRAVFGSPGEVAYELLAPLPGFVCGAALLLILASGLFASVILVGPVLLIGVPFAARGTGAMHRVLLRGLLGERIQPPPRRSRSPRGLLGRARAALTDADGWRSAAFTIAFLPVGALLVLVLATIRLYGLVTLTYPIWWWLVRSDGDHRGLGLGFGGVHLDNWAAALLTGLAGLLPMVLSTWCTRGLLDLAVRPMAHALLGPGRLDARVHVLEDTRALAVQDAAATLRRIERDLHDGAQARMVAVAMTLARARERLARLPGTEPGLVSGRELVDTALAESRTAIGELRELIRGIHPPALDDGLDVALETLAARAGIPATAETDLPVRPPEAIASIAYFCAAELLTNAARHSGATAVRIGAHVDAAPDGRVLRLTVRDDGHGGAHLRRRGAARHAGGTGLAGLAERVSTVDGRLLIVSPDGGPTTITVELPFPRRDDAEPDVLTEAR